MGVFVWSGKLFPSLRKRNACSASKIPSDVRKSRISTIKTILLLVGRVRANRALKISSALDDCKEYDHVTVGRKVGARDTIAIELRERKPWRGEEL